MNTLRCMILRVPNLKVDEVTIDCFHERSIKSYWMPKRLIAIPSRHLTLKQGHEHITAQGQSLIAARNCLQDGIETIYHQNGGVFAPTLILFSMRVCIVPKNFLSQHAIASSLDSGSNWTAAQPVVSSLLKSVWMDPNAPEITKFSPLVSTLTSCGILSRFSSTACFCSAFPTFCILIPSPTHPVYRFHTP